MLNFTPLALAMAHYRELRRQAEVKRLVDQMPKRKSFQLWGILRKKLGEGLVTLGQRLVRQNYPSLNSVRMRPLEPALTRPQRSGLAPKQRWIQGTQVNGGMRVLLSSNLYSHPKNGHAQANKSRIGRRGVNLKAVPGNDEAFRPWKHPLPP